MPAILPSAAALGYVVSPLTGLGLQGIQYEECEFLRAAFNTVGRVTSFANGQLSPRIPPSAAALGYAVSPLTGSGLAYEGSGLEDNDQLSLSGIFRKRT